jgi:hypothetical protein
MGDRKKVRVAVRPEDFCRDTNGVSFSLVTQTSYRSGRRSLNLEKVEIPATMVSPDYIKDKSGRETE